MSHQSESNMFENLWRHHKILQGFFVGLVLSGSFQMLWVSMLCKKIFTRGMNIHFWDCIVMILEISWFQKCNFQNHIGMLHGLNYLRSTANWALISLIIGQIMAYACIGGGFHGTFPIILKIILLKSEVFRYWFDIKLIFVH